MIAILTDSLAKRYSGVLAVDSVNLSVKEGSVYGFLGPNGSGKTTTLRLLLGLTRPDHGTVTLLGSSVPKHRRVVLHKVGALLQNAGIYEHLTGFDNLDISRRLLNIAKSEVDRVLDIVGMSNDARKYTSAYSLGMKQRLALGRALLGSPKLLLLDEPTNGLDPDGIMMMRELIRDLPSRIEGTVLLASHLLSEVEQVATEVGIMSHGKLVLQDSLVNLLNNGSVKVEVDQPELSKTLIMKLGFKIIQQEGNNIEFDLMDSGNMDRQIAEITKSLVNAGIAITQLQNSKTSLEKIYNEACRSK